MPPRVSDAQLGYKFVSKFTFAENLVTRSNCFTACESILLWDRKGEGGGEGRGRGMGKMRATNYTILPCMACWRFGCCFIPLVLMVGAWVQYRFARIWRYRDGGMGSA